MVTGRVVRFDEVKGYGFIAPDDGAEDVFVHANDLFDRGTRINVGTRVEFGVVDGERGLKAYEVRVLGGQRADQTVSARAASRPAPGGVNGAASPDFGQRSTGDDEMCEVYPVEEFQRQITELLLAAAPQLPGSVILELRGSILEFARKNGWVE